jgi:hypothetical protein
LTKSENSVISKSPEYPELVEGDEGRDKVTASFVGREDAPQPLESERPRPSTLLRTTLSEIEGSESKTCCGKLHHFKTKSSFEGIISIDMERLLTLKHLLPELKMAFWPCPENDFRPVFIQPRFLVFYATIFLVLKLVIFPFYYLFPKTSFFADVVSSTLVGLTNQERQARGINVLKENPILTQAANAKAQDMLAHDYFSHTSPQGVTPWYWFKKSGYNYLAAGENLAIGFIDSQEVQTAWYNSLSHRQNLLNPNYKEIGIAVVKGNFQGRETTLVVQLFGNPRIQKPVSQPTPTPLQVSISPSPAVSFSPSPSLGPKELTVLGEEQSRNGSDLAAGIVEFGATEYDQFSSIALSLFLALVVGFLLLSLARSLLNRARVADLVLETSFFAFLLLLSQLLDKSLVISLIPHQLLI